MALANPAVQPRNQLGPFTTRLKKCHVEFINDLFRPGSDKQDYLRAEFNHFFPEYVALLQEIFYRPNHDLLEDSLKTYDNQGHVQFHSSILDWALNSRYHLFYQDPATKRHVKSREIYVHNNGNFSDTIQMRTGTAAVLIHESSQYRSPLDDGHEVEITSPNAPGVLRRKRVSISKQDPTWQFPQGIPQDLRVSLHLNDVRALFGPNIQPNSLIEAPYAIRKAL